MIPIFCRLRAANSARLSHGSRRLQICRSPSIFVERQKYHRRVLTVGHKCGILILALIRRCGGMVDTGDLKSPGSNTVPVRVRSPAPSGTIKYRGVEQLVARRAHNPEVGGSSPPSATKSVTVVDTISTTVIFYLLPVWECFWNETGNISNIFGHKQIVCPDLMRPWSEKTGLGKMTIVIRI